MMRIALLAVAALTLVSCSMGQDMTIDSAAVAQFHRQFDAGQAAEIIAGAAPEMRDLPDGAAVLTKLHQKLGAFKSTSRTGFNDNFNNGEHILATKYASVYATGDASEEFQFRIKDGKASLVGYHVVSPALLK